MLCAPPHWRKPHSVWQRRQRAVQNLKWYAFSFFVFQILTVFDEFSSHWKPGEIHDANGTKRIRDSYVASIRLLRIILGKISFVQEVTYILRCQTHMYFKHERSMGHPTMRCRRAPELSQRPCSLGCLYVYLVTGIIQSCPKGRTVFGACMPTQWQELSTPFQLFVFPVHWSSFRS